MAIKQRAKASSVSLKTLKENLSEIVERVANGDVIEILKYNKPRVKLVPIGNSAIRLGRFVGRKSLVPAVKTGTAGQALKVLLEDRDE